MVREQLDSYQGELMDDEAVPEEEEAGHILDLVEMSESVIVLEHGQVVIDDGFEFELDHSMMHLLVWSPQRGDNRLVGYFMGKVEFAWSEEEMGNPSLYYIVRVGSVDRLIPAWTGVHKRFQHFEKGDRVLVLYRGLRQLKNARTYHDFLIGRKPLQGTDESIDLL